MTGEHNSTKVGRLFIKSTTDNVDIIKVQNVPELVPEKLLIMQRNSLYVNTLKKKILQLILFLAHAPNLITSREHFS